MAILPKPLGQLIDRLFLWSMKRIPRRLHSRFLYLLRMHPEIGDKWNVSIRKIGWDEPIPDYSCLDSTKTKQARFSQAIDWGIERQQSLFRNLINYHDEIMDIYKNSEFDFHNAFYPRLDPSIYYSMIRHHKPSRIVEIGSGYSTGIALLASAKNKEEGYPVDVTCIEPYPQERLTRLGTDKFTIIEQKVEDIGLDYFSKIGTGDFLFIDSSHTVKYNGDVNYEILEIMPALVRGVHVHVHDVWFPYDYPYDWIFGERRAWAEMYILEAFLAFNSAFKVELCGNMIANKCPDLVKSLWSDRIDWESMHKTGVFWMEKV